MTFPTLACLLARFADYPPDRVLLDPRPGTATKRDVIEQEQRDCLCELIDGVLVQKAPGFEKSLIATRIGHQIGDFARKCDLGIVVGANAAVEVLPGQIRSPDAAFYSWDKLPGRRIPDDPIPELHPDLAVEVLSKSNTAGEMFQKRKDYFFAGVRLVWLIDPRARAVEVYTSVTEVARLSDADTLTGGDVLPGFAVPVADLFAAGDQPV